ncbi:MAG: hypothetical protein U1E42_03635 [Rhodospirillales bacterium]
MIRLALKREPYWLDLGHGVQVHVRPCTTAVVLAARAAIAGADAEGRSAGFIRALARAAILEWEGVGDADGNPVAVSPEMIDALMDVWSIATVFERDYLTPAVLLDAEKNA